MGLKGGVKKMLRAWKPECFHDADDAEARWSVYGEGRDVVAIIDMMLTFMRVYKDDGTSTMTLRELGEYLYEHVMRPYLERPEVRALVLTADYQHRIETRAKAKLTTQRIRAEQAAAKGTTALGGGGDGDADKGPYTGDDVPLIDREACEFRRRSDGAAIPCDVHRIFFTRQLRNDVLHAMMDHVWRVRVPQGAPGVVLDFCDGKRYLLCGGGERVEMDEPHGLAEADQSVLLWARRLHRDFPNAVLHLDTVDSDIIAQAYLWVVLTWGGRWIERAPPMVWYHLRGQYAFPPRLRGKDEAQVEAREGMEAVAWVEFGEVLHYAGQRVSGGSPALFALACILQGNDFHFEKNLTPEMSEASRIAWFFGYIQAYAPELRELLAEGRADEAIRRVVVGAKYEHLRDKVPSYHRDTGRPRATVVREFDQAKAEGDVVRSALLMAELEKLDAIAAGKGKKVPDRKKDRLYTALRSELGLIHSAQQKLLTHTPRELMDRDARDLPFLDPPPCAVALKPAYWEGLEEGLRQVEVTLLYWTCAEVARCG